MKHTWILHFYMGAHKHSNLSSHRLSGGQFSWSIRVVSIAEEKCFSRLLKVNRFTIRIFCVILTSINIFRIYYKKLQKSSKITCPYLHAQEKNALISSNKKLCLSTTKIGNSLMKNRNLFFVFIERTKLFRVIIIVKFLIRFFVSTRKYDSLF